jgi:hypothetical protein
MVDSPVQQPEVAASQEQEIDMPAKKKKPAAASQGPGVIVTIVETISREKGASIEELVAVLTKKFPDREPDAMKSTCRIQVNKDCTSKDKDEKRGGLGDYKRW